MKNTRNALLPHHLARPAAAIISTLLLWLPGHAALATTDQPTTRKTDVVYLKNGDRITGEFKEMVQGELKLSTAEMGSIYIKWNGIARVESDKFIEFELTDGTRVFGKLPSDQAGLERIISMQTLKEEPFQVAMDNVVRAEQIRVNDSFWKRLDGHISLGLNYTQASDVLTWNISADARYRTTKHLTSLGFDSNLTRKGEGTDTRRHNLIGSRYWYLQKRWFYFGNLGGQQNDELGLALRVFVTGGAGRFLVQTQKTELYLAAGLQANKERETGTNDADADLSDSGANFEGVLAADYTFYRLYSPKSRIKLSGTVYPGISDTNRIRGNGNITLRQEFIKDLFWDLSFYYDYDSKPLQGAAATEDYGVVTSLGYEF
jgi:hypothetical protein